MESPRAALKLYWPTGKRSKTLASNSSARLKMALVFARESAVQIETTANFILKRPTELLRQLSGDTLRKVAAGCSLTLLVA